MVARDAEFFLVPVSPRLVWRVGLRNYWKPVWHILESDFRLMLVNARDVKNLPGRKTDVGDSVWLCQLAEAGLLRASFVSAQADPGSAVVDAVPPHADCWA